MAENRICNECESSFDVISGYYKDKTQPCKLCYKKKQNVKYIPVKNGRSVLTFSTCKVSISPSGFTIDDLTKDDKEKIAEIEKKIIKLTKEVEDLCVSSHKKNIEENPSEEKEVKNTEVNLTEDSNIFTDFINTCLTKTEDPEDTVNATNMFPIFKRFIKQSKHKNHEINQNQFTNEMVKSINLGKQVGKRWECVKIVNPLPKNK